MLHWGHDGLGILTIQQWDVNKLTEFWPIPPFDFVFNEGVPHQWPRSDPRRLGSIRQMAAVTKPGGIVAVMGSNAHCPAMMEFARTVKHTYMDMPERQEPFTVDELFSCLEKAGLDEDSLLVSPVEGILEESRTLVGCGRKL